MKLLRSIRFWLLPSKPVDGHHHELVRRRCVISHFTVRLPLSDVWADYTITVVNN